MKNSVFIDTGAFIALIDKTDQLHKKAVAVVSALETGRKITSVSVLLETALYLQRRLNQGISQQFWQSLVSSKSDIELLSPEPADLERAYQIAVQYSDQSFSWVDCTSFAIMERCRIPRAFSFDQDFLIYQFPDGPIERIPD
jgi:predicted nucleic acid-binding protein